jgi:hypothetical protein
MLIVTWKHAMNDLTAIGVFVACVIATCALARLCEWLRPAASEPTPSKGARP